MKKCFVIFLSLTFILPVFFVSCKKYEDGPAFTLLTKKQRVTGNWVYETGFVDRIERKEGLRNYFGHDYMWTIKNDGSYIETGNWEQKGVWRLIDSNSKIEFKTFSDTIYSITILRLTNKELWYEQVNSFGQLFEIHLRQ